MLPTRPHVYRRKVYYAHLLLLTGMVVSASSVVAGTVAAWGRSGTSLLNSPVGADFTAVAAGWDHNLALKSDGTVVTWGSDTWWQRTAPASLTNDIIAIAAGKEHSVALRSNGTVVAWGGMHGADLVPDDLTNVTAIAAGGYQSLALKSDGTVVGWGNMSGETLMPEGLSGLKSIAVGTSHIVTLTSNGTVVAWGGNSDGQANVPLDLSDVTAIAAGGQHSLALKSNGTVVAWGASALGQANVPVGLSGVKAIAAGEAYSVALLSNGTAVAWGDNSYGQLAVPSGLGGLTAISAGRYHILALQQTEANEAPSDILLSNSYVPANQPAGRTVGNFSALDLNWGDAHTFTLVAGDGDDDNASFTIDGTLKTSAVFNYATKSSYTIRVRVTDAGGLFYEKSFVISVIVATQPTWGTPITWGFTNHLTPVMPAGLGGVTTAISAGEHHTMALKSDGTVVAWGQSLYGQVEVPSLLSNVTAISAGYALSLALKNDGTIVGWGWRDYTNVPANAHGATAIAAGYGHGLALKSNGTVVAWGYNEFGVTNVPLGLDGVKAIDTSAEHNLAVKSNGTVVAWGSNTAGQCNVPSGLTNVIAVSAGNHHSLALKSDGTVVGWGRVENPALVDLVEFGQGTPPAGLHSVIAIAAGSSHSLALKSDGTVVAWGFNKGGQTDVPWGLRGVTAIAAGGRSTVLTDFTILKHPENRFAHTGGTATFSVAAQSNPLSYQWLRNGIELADGGNISGATTANLTVSGVASADLGTYTVRVKNLVSEQISNPATLTLDDALPSVNITSPANSARFTSGPAVIVSGTASDGRVLDRVEYAHSNTLLPQPSEYETAQITLSNGGKSATWTVVVEMEPGLNVFWARSFDTAGNVSGIKKTSFYYDISSSLKLTQTGAGSIVTASTVFLVNGSYTLTAKPALDYVFSNWVSVVVTGEEPNRMTNYVEVSTSAKYGFVMTSNLWLQANFVSNPAFGIYNGLFAESPQDRGVTHQSSGFISLKVTPKFSFSGKVAVDGDVVPVSGVFGLNGTASGVLVNRAKQGKEPLSLTMALSLDGSVDQLTGTVACAAEAWTSGLRADRAAFSLVNPATDFTNSYTMLLPAGNEGPSGSSYGLVKIDSLGRVKLSGHRADGHGLKQGTVLSKEGYWPLFSPMYVERRTVGDKTFKVTKGFTMGWLQFTNNNGVGNLAPVGEVHWIKTGWTNSTYATGFSNSVDVIGSRWLAPVPKSGIRGLVMTNVTLEFSAGDLGSPFGATYFVTTNTTLAVIKPATVAAYPHKLTTGLSPKTGVIKGNFLHPDNGELSTRWFGVMLQDQNYGEGFFMGPTVGGKLEVAPAPEE